MGCLLLYAGHKAKEKKMAVEAKCQKAKIIKDHLMQLLEFGENEICIETWLSRSAIMFKAKDHMYLALRKK